jgi:cytochrome c oxidase subunit 2
MPSWLVKLLFLPVEASSVAGQVDALHAVIITVTLVSSVGVFGAAAWMVFRYRRRADNETTPHVVAKHSTEIGLGLMLLGLFIAFWVVGFRQYLTLEQPPDDARTVFVTARQWMWKFSYADGRSAEDVLVVPRGATVKLAMTSRDVIHSFYVPAFRIKQDVVPGRYTTTWFRADTAGSYPILCAEYCGTDHSAMRGQVVVLEPADYARWIDDSSRDRSGARDLASQGREVAVRRACVACHSVGTQVGTGPSWAGLYGSYVDLRGGGRVIADEAYLTKSMMEPNADILSGFQPVMPTYAGTLEAAEVAALVEYIESLREPQEPGVNLPRVRAVEPTEDAAPPAATDLPPTDGGAR